MLKDTPENKQESTGTFKFGYSGLVIFIITMFTLNIFITYRTDLGWASPLTIGVIVVTIISSIVFIKVEKSKDTMLIDFTVFKNKPYTDAGISNFLLNAMAGTLVGSGHETDLFAWSSLHHFGIHWIYFIWSWNLCDPINRYICI